MNNIYTDNVYVLYHNEEEKTRFINYIKSSDIKLNYQLIESIKCNEEDDIISTFDRKINFSNVYFENCLNNYKDYKLNKNQISHIKSICNILLDAIKNNYDSITILEYDILINKNYNDILPKYKNLINNCDLIYLGSSQNFWYNPINYTVIDFRDNNTSPYYIANHSLGTFSIILKKDVIKLYLEYLNLFLFSSDIVLSIISQQFKSIVIYPNLIICDIETSNILKNRDVDKTFLKFKWEKKNYLM